MSGLKEVCKCGHDKATHYRDPATGERCGCLGMSCDNCKSYREVGTPDTLRAPPEKSQVSTSSNHLGKPHSSLACLCDGCLLYRRRFGW